MTEDIVREWLTDYNALSSQDEVHRFATSLVTNQDLVTALNAIWEEKGKYQESMDRVCDQLFTFYRSDEPELRYFTLHFLPSLIYVYLNAVSHGDKKSCHSVETLLIGMFNLEVVGENGQPKIISYRFPSLAQSSIYHDPMSLAPASLTEAALKRLEECNTKLIKWGPFSQVERLNAQNRLKVMTSLLFVYNRHLSLLPKQALYQLCKVTSKLVTQGFTKSGHQKRSSYGSDGSFVTRVLPRIPVCAPFLLQLVHAVYLAITYPNSICELPVVLDSLTPTFYCHFSRFNDFASIGTQALEDISNRATFELFPDVLLVTGAIKNSLCVNPSGQPSDGPMGISVAISPSTTTVSNVSKNLITNASFRTKKLPDDIPIQTDGEKNLTSITEDNEDETANEGTPGSAFSRHSGGQSSIKSKEKGIKFPSIMKKKDGDKNKTKPSAIPKDISGDRIRKDSERHSKKSNKSVGSLMNGGDTIDNLERDFSVSVLDDATEAESMTSLYSDSLDFSNSIDLDADERSDSMRTSHIKDVSNGTFNSTTTV